MKELPESEVKVKMSICPDCGNMIRCAVEHKMDKKRTKEFMKEVAELKLDLKTITLLEYRKNKPDFCGRMGGGQCKTKIA